VIERILVVGYGSIGKRHLRIVREQLPNATVMVLRHQPTQDIPELADWVTSSLDETIAFKPEIAVIATPAPFHLQTAACLAEAGCHLLIEKPLAAQTEGVSEFLSRIRSAKRVCQVGYNLRFLPSLVEFRKRVLQGDIGRVLSVRCEVGQYLSDWRSGSDYRKGVSARQELGGGVLLELSHELDYMSWMLGPVKWVSAWSGQLSDLKIDVEDTAFLTLGYSSLITGREVVATVALDFVRRDTTRTCLAIGSEGSLRWNALNGTVEWYPANASDWEPVFSNTQARDESYRDQFKSFLACVKSGASPLVDGEDGLATLRIIEAARSSMDKGGVRQYLQEFQSE